MNTQLKVLLTHLANPTLSTHLRQLHDLALYDSGDALLGDEEKDSLLAAKSLADLLDTIPRKDILDLL